MPYKTGYQSQKINENQSKRSSTMLSPYVQKVLDDNNFSLTEVLRYGPRFACLLVECNGSQGFFKMSLPLEEQRLHRPDDYFWTPHDNMDELDRRLIREAIVLEYLTTEMNGDFEPKIIATSQESPVWSLRTFIKTPGYEVGDSNFMFDERFYIEQSPQSLMNFFLRLRDTSDNMPESLRAQLIPQTSYREEYRNRFNRVLEFARKSNEFEPYVETIASKFDVIFDPANTSSVLSHGEPYPPHFFAHNGTLGLIDWENAQFREPIYDLATVYLRLFPNPTWQAEFLEEITTNGYFENGALAVWDAYILYSSLFHYQWVSEGKSLGTEAFGNAASKYFKATILRIVEADKD
jgi:thiamine kinase-like enzyme